MLTRIYGYYFPTETVMILVFLKRQKKRPQKDWQELEYSISHEGWNGLPLWLPRVRYQGEPDNFLYFCSQKKRIQINNTYSNVNFTRYRTL